MSLHLHVPPCDHLPGDHPGCGPGDFTRKQRIRNHNRALRRAYVEALAKLPRFLPCTACGGGVEFDEEGKPYTCFRCCDTGRLPALSVLEEERREAWHALLRAERFIAERAHIARLIDAAEPDDYDPETAEWLMHKARRYGLIEREPAAVERAGFASMDDDIPF